MSQQQQADDFSLGSSPRRVHHHGATSNQLAKLTLAIERLAQAVGQMVHQGPSSAAWLTFEEVEAITQFKRTKLEAMIDSGRLQEGRHYIKEGHYRFHPELQRLMFDDKLAVEGENTSVDEDQQQVSRSGRGRKRNLSRAETAVNLGYLQGKRL